MVKMRVGLEGYFLEEKENEGIARVGRKGI